MGSTPHPDPETTARLEIAPGYNPDAVAGVLISIWDETGNREDHYYPDPGFSTADPAVAIVDPELYSVNGVPPTRAYVSISFESSDGAYSTGNAIVVLPEG